MRQVFVGQGSLDNRALAKRRRLIPLEVLMSSGFPQTPRYNISNYTAHSSKAFRGRWHKNHRKT